MEDNHGGMIAKENVGVLTHFHVLLYQLPTRVHDVPSSQLEEIGPFRVAKLLGELPNVIVLQRRVANPTLVALDDISVLGETKNGNIVTSPAQFNTQSNVGLMVSPRSPGQE